MKKNKNCFLDANTILRYLLNDIPEQYEQVQEIVSSCQCITSLEVIAEVIYILTGVYSVKRKECAKALRILSKEIMILYSEVLEFALNEFESGSLDFVDCLICGYHRVFGIDVVTFDKKLKRRIEGAS